MSRTIPDELLHEAVRVRSESRTLGEAAQKIGIKHHTLTNRLLRAAQRGIDGSVPKPLPLGQILRGVSTLYRMNPDGTSDEVLQWVKTKDDKQTQDFIEAIKSTFDEYKGKSTPIDAPVAIDKDLLSVYPIADQHIGLMSWGEETGENYDLKIGAERLRTSARRLIGQSPLSKEAIILNLGDWQHNDDARNATPQSGNPLDVDGRYFKVLTTGIQLMMDVIDLALQKHETVTVRNLPGNHDPHASIALTVALSAFYSSNPRVIVDDDPSEFFFRKFGQTLFGANHGHRMKPTNMAMLMACMRREDWGATKYHWFLFGHIHNTTVKEVGDVRVESFQTIAAKDAWSVAKGFTSGKSLTSVTLHHDEGEIGRHKVNV